MKSGFFKTITPVLSSTVIFASLFSGSSGSLFAQEGIQALEETPRITGRTGEREDDDTVYITTGPEGASHFDVDQGVIIFTGDVEVDHPQFHITCDELTLHLKDDSAPDADGSAGTEAGDIADEAGEIPAAASAEEEDEGGEEDDTSDVAENALGLTDSSIETAIATGRKVVIRKLAGEKGKAQIGQCRHAIYDGETGDMTLRDWPTVQRGNHLVVGTVQSTTIILRQEGQHEVIGASEARIVRGEGE